MKSLLAVLLLALNLFALDIPELSSRVVDNGNFFSNTQKQQLVSKLENIETNTSNQIAVLTLSSLDGEALEDYSIKVVESWKLGQKGKDNGVLILLVKDSHEIRIEVGYGLEGAIPDGLAGSIIRGDMVPNFKKGDFYKGVDEAITHIDQATRGEYKADEPMFNDGIDFEQLLFIFGIFFASIIGSIKMSRIVGAILGAIGSFIIGLIFISQSFGVLAILALIGAILGAIFGPIKGAVNVMGFGGSSRGGRGGGFSGGGGGFGGGGASGRW